MPIPKTLVESLRATRRSKLEFADESRITLQGRSFHEHSAIQRTTFFRCVFDASQGRSPSTVVRSPSFCSSVRAARFCEWPGCISVPQRCFATLTNEYRRFVQCGGSDSQRPTARGWCDITIQRDPVAGRSLAHLPAYPPQESSRQSRPGHSIVRFRLRAPGHNGAVGATQFVQRVNVHRRGVRQIDWSVAARGAIHTLWTVSAASANSCDADVSRRGDRGPL